MITLKDKVQEVAKQAWIDYGRSGTIVLGTGGGKSKIAIDLTNLFSPINVLILVNSTILKENWSNELKKYDNYSKNIYTIETYQTAYKWYPIQVFNRGYDFIVYDECDWAATEEYGVVFREFKCTYKLGLTGFIPADKQDFFDKYLPVCYIKTAQELQEEGVLNKSEIIVINYPLSRIPDIKIPKKNGTFFTQSENDYYRYYNAEVKKTQVVRSSADQKVRLFPTTENEEAFKRADWRAMMTVAKRKKILNGLTSSIKVVQALVKQIHSKPGNKVLIFSGITDQCDRLGYPTYHGKKNSTEKSLDRLNSGEITTTAVCKAVDRGVNLVGVNHLIKESFDGSEVTFHQTYGRLLRLKEGQVAKYIILVPTYIEKTGLIATTQQGVWAEKMMREFDSIPRVIKLGADLKLKEGIEL